MKLRGQLELAQDLSGNYLFRFQSGPRRSRRFSRRNARDAAQDLHGLFGFPPFYALQMLSRLAPGENRALDASISYVHFQLLREN